MVEQMRQFLKTWFQNLLSDSNEVQTKKVAYLLVVLVGAGCLIGDLCLELVLTNQWVAAFGILTGFVTSGYLIGKKIEK